MSRPVSTITLRFLRNLSRTFPPLHKRSLSTCPWLCSGHSKWATIKHDKAKKDSRVNRERVIYARDIQNAVRMYGADPKYNAKLATAVSNAQRTGMPKSSIEAAILRGQGKSATGAKLESLLVEAIWGGGKPVAMIVEAETDSKAMALQELRSILKNAEASQTPTQFLFQRRGRITLPQNDGVDVDQTIEAVLNESGVVDVKTDDQGSVVVDTEPDALKAVEKRATEQLNVQAVRAETVWHANEDTLVEDLEDTQLDEIDKLTEKLEEYPGVQKVWTNLAM